MADLINNNDNSTGLFSIIKKVFSPLFTAPEKRYGNRGERKAGSVLERYLPGNYTVIQNVKVSYDGKTSEIDNVVVGRTGVFIIEVKNMKGNILGDCASRQWSQIKIDQYDIEHQKEFYSPIKQVGTHIYRLANYLRDNRIFTHINGAVYFANRQTRVHLNGKENDIPVFTYKSTNALINYITSGEEALNNKQIEKIISLLT